MRHAVVWAAAVGLLAGCSSDAPQSYDALTAEQRAELAVVDYGELKGLLAKHKGKVVVLAGWSLHQEGGEELHGRLGELHKPGEKHGPVVIALSLDSPADARSTVLPLIREQRPAFTSCVFGDDQMMLLGLGDDTWGGLLPAVWVFDPGGKLAGSFAGPNAFEQARGKLEAMEAQGGAKR